MNKILNSPLKAKIDEMLLSGKTVYEVETWCRENGLLISATSLKRYAEINLPDWKGSKPIPTISQTKDNDNNFNDRVYKICLPKIESAKQLNQIISENLKETIVNLVTIVNAKVSEYALGDAALPKDDIAVLEKVVGIFNSITSKHNEDRSGKNIFDIDEALERDEKRSSSAGTELQNYLDSLKVETSD